jgi:hypothetical protein
MVLRQRAYELSATKAPLGEVVALAREASAAFENAREWGPDDEYGFINEVQMLIRVLDYAGQGQSEGVLGYIAKSGTDPFLREAIGRAEDLLDQVRRSRGGEIPSSYEEDCRGKLDALYRRYDRALQTWDGLLNRRDVYHPPIRRQIIWTYLARHERRWKDLQPRELDRILLLLDQNRTEEPRNEKDLRLWVRAVRRSKFPPTVDAILERIGYWKMNSGSLDALYYLYVLYALQAIEGSAVALDETNRYQEECRKQARQRGNRTKSFEWFGTGTGIQRLIHHSDLGPWLPDKDFWQDDRQLAHIAGRIARIDAPQSGYIELESGLRAFFVPARGGYSRNQSENVRVQCYLGFSYDGLQAWGVDALT